MIVWGGSLSTGRTNTGSRYNLSSDVWTATSVTGSVPSIRDSHTAVWTGIEMIIFGGTNGTVSYNNGGKYDPALNTWTATATGANVPTIRDTHAAVWNGDTGADEMIIWGGRDRASGTYRTDSSRYTP
jgi:hypothetical protein